MTRLLIAVVTVCALASAVTAQTGTSVRGLGPVVATSTARFRMIDAVRELPRGELLLHELRSGNVHLLDGALRTARVAYAGPQGAPAAAGILVDHQADSVLFIADAGRRVVVIDAHGNVARVDSLPAMPLPFLLRSSVIRGDRQGYLYFEPTRRAGERPSGPAARSASALETVPLARVRLGSSTLDTVAQLANNVVEARLLPRAGGGFTPSFATNPLPVVDDWTIVADGSVALVRGADFHVDWLSASLATSASAAIAFPWVELSADDKRRIADSARIAAESLRARMTQTAGRSGVTPSRGVSATISMVEADGLPDRRPAFRRGATLPDLEGRLWVEVTLPKRGGGPMYYVIDRDGKLVDRVQLPAGRSLVGFGRGGMVYLSAPIDSGVALQRVRLR